MYPAHADQLRRGTGEVGGSVLAGTTFGDARITSGNRTATYFCHRRGAASSSARPRSDQPPSARGRPAWPRPDGLTAPLQARAFAPDLLDLEECSPQVGEPAVLMLADQPDAPGERIAAAPGDAGVHQGVEY